MAEPQAFSGPCAFCCPDGTGNLSPVPALARLVSGGVPSEQCVPSVPPGGPAQHPGSPLHLTAAPGHLLSPPLLHSSGKGHKKVDLQGHSRFRLLPEKRES